MPKGRFRVDDIELLEGLEAVRRRPTMYVGDTANAAALTQLVCEPLCLAIDANTGGPAREVEIEVRPDQSVRVRNDGPGIPVFDRHDGTSSITTIFTRIGACRDMKADSDHRRWCGSGVAIANALSAWCRVEVRRDGACWRQAFERGRPTGPVERSAGDQTTGTSVEFLPDATILSAKIDAGEVVDRLQEFNGDFPCLDLVFRDARSQEPAVWHWPGAS